MSLRNIKKLQTPDFLANTDESEESEAAPRKSANNFELVRQINHRICSGISPIFGLTSTRVFFFFALCYQSEMARE